MTDTNRNWPISNISDSFGGNLACPTDSETMGKEERKQRVLAFLVDARLALPRIALFRNLSYQGADFSDSSLKNYLRELREEGYVERIDAERFADGSVEVSDSDPGYWIPTSEGVEFVENLREDQRGDIETEHL